MNQLSKERRVTTRVQPRFTVKEYASGETWIAIECQKQDPGMPVGLFGFDLPKGTSVAVAQQIARDLQAKLGPFTYTP